MNRELTKKGRELGIDKANAKRLANMTVQELQNDNILLGELLVRVKKI